MKVSYNKKRSILPGLVLVLLIGCDNQNETASNSPAAAGSSQTLQQIEEPTNINEDISSPEQITAVDVPTPTAQNDAAFQKFLGATEDDQADLALFMEGSADDALLVARLLRESISVDNKLALLSAIEDGEYEHILPALEVALSDDSPDVVLAAIDILDTLQLPESIPLLQPLANNSPNEDIRESAQSVLEELQL